MRVKVTKTQFQLLINNLHWLEGKSMLLTGKTVKAIMNLVPR